MGCQNDHRIAFFKWKQERFQGSSIWPCIWPQRQRVSTDVSYQALQTTLPHQNKCWRRHKRKRRSKGHDPKRRWNIKDDSNLTHDANPHNMMEQKQDTTQWYSLQNNTTQDDSGGVQKRSDTTNNTAPRHSMHTCTRHKKDSIYHLTSSKNRDNFENVVIERWTRETLMWKRKHGYMTSLLTHPANGFAATKPGWILNKSVLTSSRLVPQKFAPPI